MLTRQQSVVGQRDKAIKDVGNCVERQKERVKGVVDKAKF